MSFRKACQYAGPEHPPCGDGGGARDFWGLLCYVISLHQAAMPSAPLPRRPLLLAAAGLPFLPRPAAAQPAADQFRVVTSQEINGLDPARSGYVFTRMQVLETLVGADDGGLPVPQLARAWTLSEDRLTWRFALREGARFHDGTPVTAGAVAAHAGAAGRRGTAVLRLRAAGGAARRLAEAPAAWPGRRGAGAAGAAARRAGHRLRAGRVPAALHRRRPGAVGGVLPRGWRISACRAPAGATRSSSPAA